MMPRPHRLPLLALGTLLTIAAPAQQSSSPPPGATVLQTGTQLVLVDVVVEDSNGRPVHGLKLEDFAITEDKKPQAIRVFEPHSADQPSKPGPEFPPMPPGIFTNYTPVPAGGALNILLLDTLNTPMTDQSYVRYQLQQYVKKADPGTRIAIFGLGMRLYLLQGFTSDPTVLKEAVEHKLIPRASNLLDDPVGTGVQAQSLSSMISNSTVASNVTQFEAENAAFQSQLRTQYTLDAFNDIAHYLSNFPGRKNLIWFSGSFPIDLLPDPDLSDPFSVQFNNDKEFQETTNLLGRSQVAVYPIDARGLMTNPTFSAANSGSSIVRGGPAALNKSIRTFETSQASEHSTMDRMAEATGGRAFYNTNGLAQAVSLALNSGANYYTLAYTPSNQDWNENYRSIKVTLAGAFANPNLNLKLTYRHGYYAIDPGSTKHAASAPTISSADTTTTHAAEAYHRNAISHGAPLPEDILFKVRAIPASATTEDKVAPYNETDPNKPLKGPFRRYAIDYAALPSDFQLVPDAKGNHIGAIDFSVFLYSPEGYLLNATGQTVELNLTPANYTGFRNTPVSYHLEISAPVKGESYLRIILHDVSSNHFGAVEIPVSAISNLPPATPITPAPTTPTH